MRHRERLLRSSALFARKFDEDADADILGVLAARIGASAPREPQGAAPRPLSSA